MDENSNNHVHDLETLFQNMNEGVCIHELVHDEIGKPVDYRITEVNPSYENITNIHRDQAVGKLASELYGTGEAPFLERYARVANTGKSETFEIYWAPMDKHFKVSVISQQGGKFATVFFDISDIKMLQKKEKVLLDRYQLAVKGAQDGLWDLDILNKNLYVSPHYEELLGFKTGEIKNPYEDWEPRLHPDDKKRVLDRIQDHLKNRVPYDIEYRLRTKSGEYRTFSAKGLALRDENGIPVRFAGSIRDITENKQLEIKTQHAQKMESIGQLAGGIAHDFNNQLAGIVGYVDILRDELSNRPELLYYVDNILLATKRASDLTSQLLAFARKGKYLSVTFDIHKIIGEVVGILQRTIDKRIVLKQRLNDQMAQIHGDPTQIQNAIMNIALNARDAMPDGGELIISTSIVQLDKKYSKTKSFEIIPGDYVLTCITDTGVGMDEDTREKVFEPFFTTKEQGKGTGMGLASVYGTVKNHKGAIIVKSGLGDGTTIKMYLPHIDSDAVSEFETIKQTESVQVNLHVLLVDDEELVCKITSMMLEKSGYKVSICGNGREAVAHYRNNWKNIDIVILDMVMPEMNGREAFFEMKKINPQIQAILSSGYSINGSTSQILAEGVMGFIQKPYCRTELIRKVADVLKADAGREE